MSNVFDIQRFSLCLKADFLLNRKNIMWMLLGYVMAFLLMAYMFELSPLGGAAERSVVFNFFMAFISVVSYSLAFYDQRVPSRVLVVAMQPSSALEKYVVRILLTVALCMAGYCIFFLIEGARCLLSMDYPGFMSVYGFSGMGMMEMYGISGSPLVFLALYVSGFFIPVYFSSACGFKGVLWFVWSYVFSVAFMGMTAMKTGVVDSGKLWTVLTVSKCTTVFNILPLVHAAYRVTKVRLCSVVWSSLVAMVVLAVNVCCSYALLTYSDVSLCAYVILLVQLVAIVYGSYYVFKNVQIK